MATLRSSCVTWLGAHVSAAPDEGFWRLLDARLQLATTLVRRIPRNLTRNMCNQPHRAHHAWSSTGTVVKLSIPQRQQRRASRGRHWGAPSPAQWSWPAWTIPPGARASAAASASSRVGPQPRNIGIWPRSRRAPRSRPGRWPADDSR
ncbi:hypothetical protein I550_2707 [Mycobacterium intracellulare 1956]|uniref:Uncharacterized protein n=1 Tax=Mycobacterium intracellulare 1956 TaxID=1299331 RepID=X8CU05_MYCIT|nr:hypothetical protein I550_2707 [Mycobacterium intracellulare 1956]